MWSTQEDVLNDLARAGHPVANIDTTFIVRGGERPPPPQRYLPAYNDFDEMELRFGVEGYPARRQGWSHEQGPTVPDLAGITRMLRQVNTTEDGEVNHSSKEKLNEQKQHEIVISKLNPNVKEFVPKLATKPATAKLRGKKTLEPAEKAAEISCKADKENIDAKNVKKLEKVPPEATFEQRKTKNLAIASSQEATFEQKKTKNLAIAELLRIHSLPATSVPRASTPNLTPAAASSSSPQPTRVTSSSPKLVLFTPEYFMEHTTAAEKEQDVEKEAPQEELPEPKVLLTPKNTPTDVVDPEIKESIYKVQNWLKIPEKKLQPSAPFLGPVVFKKKDASIAQSPTPDSAVPKPVPSTSWKIPTESVEEMMKRFQKQAREKEENEERQRLANMDCGDSAVPKPVPSTSWKIPTESAEEMMKTSQKEAREKEERQRLANMDCADSAVPKPVPSTSWKIPTESAEEMMKRFQKQAREKEEKEERKRLANMDWGDRLVMELKKRDEIILKKRESDSQS